MGLQLSEADVWAARAELAKRSFSHFIRALDIPGAPIRDDDECEEYQFFRVDEFAAHHAFLIDRLQALADAGENDCRNVMVFMPPGSAKSTYASVMFPAWLMTRKSGYQFILGSYNSTLAKKMGRKVRALVNSPKYRRLFSDIALMSDQKAADEFALSNGSEYMSGGVSSGITGNRADAVAIDDPVKGREEAESETTRTKVAEGYDDDFRTRLKPNGIKLIILTRWHEDDLAGHILPKDWDGESGMIECRDGEVWDVIRIPAKAEVNDIIGRKVDEYLWPEWFPASHWVPFERKARTWSSLFQGRPSPEDGEYFLREWFDLYEPGAHPKVRHYGSSDYAVSDGENDFTWLLNWGVCREGDLWLIDVWIVTGKPLP